MTNGNYRVRVAKVAHNRFEVKIGGFRFFVRSRVLHFFGNRREFGFDFGEIGANIRQIFESEVFVHGYLLLYKRKASVSDARL